MIADNDEEQNRRGSSSQAEVMQVDDGEQSLHSSVIFQKTSSLQKVWLWRRSLCFVFIFLFFFIWWATVRDMSCDAKMSAPHTSNRVISETKCVIHSPEPVSLEVSNALGGSKSDSDIYFLVIGNFGRDGFCCQNDVAIEMEKAASTLGASFVINTGNAFFPEGIKSVTEEQIDTSWRNIYNGPLLSTLPWYSALGEAEYLGDISMVKQLSNAEPRFYSPKPYYDKIVKSNDKKLQLHMFFLDTTALIRSKEKQNDAQLLFLKSGLQTTTADLVIVVGFHTPHSDLNLKSYLVPVLEGGIVGGGIPSKTVIAYFSGRELTLQWYAGSVTDYFVTGAGAEILKGENPFQIPNFISDNQGFLACSAKISKDGKPILKTALVDMNGHVVKVVAR